MRFPILIGLSVFTVVAAVYFLNFNPAGKYQAVGRDAVIATLGEGVVLGLVSGLMVGTLFFLLSECWALFTWRA
jgi:hypothetical protein